MARLLDTLDRARRDSSSDIHFALQLDRLFESVEGGEDLTENVRLQLQEMEGSYLLPELVGDLQDWYGDEDFDSAIDGLDQLETAIEDAEQEGWLNVALQYHYRRIKLKAGLQGHDAGDEIEIALDFLEVNHPDISSNFLSPLLDTVIENVDDLTNSIKNRYIALLEEVASGHETANRFNREREFLRLLRRLKHQCGQDTTDAENELVKSYRSEADLLEERSKLQKADTLQSGVAECSEWMTDQQKTDWKQEAFQARREGLEEELAEINLEDLDVDTEPGETLEDAVTREMSRNTETIVEWFKHVQEQFDTTYALYCLALSRSLIPDVNKIRLSTEEYVFSELFQRRVYSPEAHTLSVDPSEIDNIPGSYGHEVGSKMSSLGNALYQLIKEGHITPVDIFQLFWISESLSPDTDAFLTEGLFNLYEDNHLEALFILVPHLEAAIVDTLQSVGNPAYSIVEHGTRQQLLGGLFIEGSDLFGEHYSIYLRYRYTSREGMNIRNRLSHGQLCFWNAGYLNTVLVLFDIIKCMVTINISRYLGYFGLPWRTLSPTSPHRDGVDLSLFTDLNKQIIGHGQSVNGNTIVVIRENHRDERTEIYTDNGTINRYIIGSIGLTRDEIKDEIEELRDDHPDIPESIDYTWLDEESLILQTVKAVIDETIENPADSKPKDLILEKSKPRGIDGSTARIAISALEDRCVITVVEIDEQEEIRYSDEKIQIFEAAQGIEGVGDHLAWEVADHFDTLQEFSDSTEQELREVDGIGQELSRRISNG